MNSMCSCQSTKTPLHDRASLAILPILNLVSWVKQCDVQQGRGSLVPNPAPPQERVGRGDKTRVRAGEQGAFDWRKTIEEKSHGRSIFIIMLDN